jgi:hypothetical protein
MIWFACKSCGKQHGRAENLAGTMVFCDCGQGNRVPWSSTVPEPEPEPEPARAAEPAPVPPRQPAAPPPPIEDFPSPPPRRREPRRINPAFCLNHEDDASTAVCAACRCSFCAACVATLQETTLCGPCKNFRVRGLHRRSHVAPLAIAAFVVALISGPVAFVLGLVAVGSRSLTGMSIALVFCVVAMLLPAGAFALSWAALKQIETTSGRGGRVLAAIGATTALAGLLWTQGIALVVILKHFQE